jgi:hypothetical protein
MGVFLVLSSQGFGQSQREDQSMGDTRTAIAGDEQSLDLSQVPQPARNAAQKALGSTPTEAKMVAGTNPQQYELTGKDTSGRVMSVRVLEDGKMVKRKTVR